MMMLHLILVTRYDVWLVDWRVSCNLPSMVRKDYTLDDCAAYDYPAAINKVIEVTKQVYLYSHTLRWATLIWKRQGRSSKILKRTSKRYQARFCFVVMA